VQSGGQVDDTGTIRGEGFVAEVIASFRHDRKIVHEVRVLQGPTARIDGLTVHASVDPARRRNIERNHTATHLVHEALRRVLGQHLHQQGSLVAPDRLRFDFNHFEKIAPDQLRAIEDIVNEKLAESVPVNALNDPREWLTIDEARRRYPNVKMFFGDRYGDRVRIVEIDPQFSVELCGGTHVGNTRDIGIFKIVAESSIASGTRRIEAVTGAGVQQYVDEQVRRLETLDDTLALLQEEVNDLQRQLGRNPSTHSMPHRSRGESLTAQGMRLDAVRSLDTMVLERAAQVSETTRASLDLAKDLAKERVRTSAAWIAEQVASAVSLHGVKIVAARIDGVPPEELKSMGDSLRSQLKSGVGVLAGVTGDKVGLVCVVTDDLIKTKNIHAGKIVGALAQRIGGGGGGRPHLATAGGKDAEKLDEMLREAPAIVSQMLAPPR
jgi:alanyl-tRNA synthetase